MDSGSYLLLAVGMPVAGLSGDELGRISDVVADEYADIFRGIVVSTGLFGHGVFVSGEHVRSVSADRATVDLSREQFALLPDASGLTVRTSS